ncbi:MAG: SIS domain-containing protein [Chryseosolibacter sp.]
MEYLGMALSALETKGAAHTAREIVQQPDLWQKIWHAVNDQRPELAKFLNTALADSKRVILTGAGTSAFIGLSLRGIIMRQTGLVTEAIASTDLVSHPRDFFSASIPTLLISFARSGNSPESVATVSLADEIGGNCYHLVITCNADGKLARHDSEHKYVLTLPPEANDQSLAMTSSYTGMLLAGILVAHLNNLEAARKSVDVLTCYGRRIIDVYAADLAKIAEKDFRRAVFLGSGPFFGAARESQLKLQEFTDGKIICKEDSFLGFRHGPKAVVDEATLVCYIFSNEEYASKYERDFVRSMRKGRAPLLEIGIMEKRLPGIQLDHTIYLTENSQGLEEEYLAVCSVLPAQILGFYKSLHIGLKPDMPSVTGAITRVVEGVRIYELNV